MPSRTADESKREEYYILKRERTVARISRFFVIVIYVLYENNIPAHFHAAYGDDKISVTIDSGVIEGEFPKRALRAVLEWAEIHRSNFPRIAY